MTSYQSAHDVKSRQTYAFTNTGQQMSRGMRVQNAQGTCSVCVIKINEVENVPGSFRSRSLAAA